MEHINKVGNIVTQNTESEDKTSTVIDVEAKIKNLTEFAESVPYDVDYPNRQFERRGGG